MRTGNGRKESSPLSRGNRGVGQDHVVAIEGAQVTHEAVADTTQHV